MFAGSDLLEKLKKIDLIGSVENTIASKLDIKASLQAMHLKEEQNNLPTEVT